MAYPQVIYLYQENNNADYAWKIAFSKEEIPVGAKVGIYAFQRKAIAEVVVSDAVAEDIAEV